MMKQRNKGFSVPAGPEPGRAGTARVGPWLVLVVGLVGCQPAATEEVALEFARVQRQLNDRVGELEDELELVRAEAAEALDTYQITTNELVNEVRQVRRKLAEAQADLKNVRAMEETWSVRKGPGETEPGPAPVAGPTMAQVEQAGGPVSFDSIFDEVDDEDDEAGAEEDDGEDADCPLLVSGMKFLGHKRLEGRRDSKYWTKAMELDLENPTSRPVPIQMWAHPPPDMGWYYDDFGPKRMTLKPGQKKQNIVIPYNPDYQLFLLVDKTMHTFPLREGGP